MNPIVYRITLDLSENGVQYVVSGIKAGDTNRKIEIRLTNNGTPYEIEPGTVAQIRANVGVVNHVDLCDVEGNVISYTVNPNMISIEGETIADVELGKYDEEGAFQSFATAEIMFLVYEPVVDTGTVPQAYQGSILEAVSAATSAATNAEAWAGNAETAAYKASNAATTAETAAKNANVAAEDAQGQTISSAELTEDFEIRFTKENGSKILVPGSVRGPEGEPDYSLVANALKGKKSGNPIALPDVSPLPHEIKVKLKPEEGFAGEKILTDQYEFFSGDGVYVPNNKQYDENDGWCYEFEDGSYLYNAGYDLDKIVVKDGKPYRTLDVNGAVVQKFFGKNYSPVSSNTWTGSWTTLRPTEPLKAGKKYLFIADVTTTSSDGVVTVYDAGNGKYSYWKAGENSSYILSVGEKDCDLIWIHAQRGYVSGSTNVATLNRFVIAEEQEPEILTADEEGNISLVGNGESMTLIGEDGVTMEAEYNRDINKAFAELLEKIGGNV